MAGFAALIGGAGQAAAPYGQQMREQAFQHQQNELNRWQLQHQNLANAIEGAAGKYAGPEGERLRDLQMEVNSLRPGTELTPYFQKYTQHRQKAQQEIAQAAVQGAQGGVGAGMGGAGAAQPAIPPVGAAAAPQAPLAPMMGAPGAGSPVNPVQGGASGQGATFPGPNAVPNAPVPAASASAPAVGPVGQLAPGAQQSIPPAAVAPPDAPNAAGSSLLSMGSPLDLQRSFDAFNNTGYIDPITEAMIPGQAQLATGVQRLPLVQKILGELQQPKGENGQPAFPDIGNLLKVEAELSSLGVQGGGLGNMLGPMLSAMTPQAEAGMTTVAALESTYPGFLASKGYDVASLDPNTPMRVQVNKFTRMPVSAQLQSVADRFLYGNQGQVLPVNPRTQEVGPAVPGAVNPAFVPTNSSSTLTVPGQLPQTTTTTKTKGIAGAGTGGARGISPVVPPAGSGGGTRGAAGSGSPQIQGSPLVIQKYKDWVNGGPAPTGKELTAVQDLISKNPGLTTPTPMSPTGQKALATIDPIMEEVDRALGTMDKLKIDKMGKTDLMKAYAEYKLGIDNPLADFIADIGFADLRSGAQALSGTGSRAERILNKALEHTPHMSVLTFDEPSLIRKKLQDMKIRLQEAKQATLEDEKKSGILMGAPPVPAGAGGNRDPLGIR